MANSSHQEANRLRRHGQDRDVEVVGKKIIRRWGRKFQLLLRGGQARQSREQLATHTVRHSVERVRPAPRWAAAKGRVLGTDALLDDGPKNAGSEEPYTMLITCMGFALVTITGLTVKMVCRTSHRRLTEFQ